MVFLAVSKLIYFAKLQRKGFSASRVSHDQQPHVATAGNHEEDDHRKQLEDRDAACFLMTYSVNKHLRLILIVFFI